MGILDVFKKEDGKPDEDSTQILIVEDSRTQAHRLRLILEQHDYEVIVTSNGAEAIALLEKQRPALVISDIMMPEKDGYELCLHIKSDENFKSIPVILMTSLDDPNEAVKGLYCGADILMAKPFNEHFLLSRIKKILSDLEMRRLQRLDGDDVEQADKGIHISIGGRKNFITSERLQTIDLLLSTYEIAMQKSIELKTTTDRIGQLEAELKRVNGTAG